MQSSPEGSLCNIIYAEGKVIELQAHSLRSIALLSFAFFGRKEKNWILWFYVTSLNPHLTQMWKKNEEISLMSPDPTP